MNNHVTDNEAKAMIKGALLYRYGETAAFNTDILAATWDCWCNALSNGSSLQETISECVDCININAFITK